MQVQSLSWKLYIADDNDVQPHPIQEHNERISTEFSSVTTQSTVQEPPKDGRKYGPKHVFKMLLSVLSINVNWCF
jgi:hypothetical protein